MRPPIRHLLGVIVAVLAVNAVGSIPAFAFGAETGWFEPPPFYPPEYAFGIVWPVLFALKGVAVYLVIQAGWARANVRRAVAVFGCQFLLNLLWTPVFFGLRRPDLGLIVLIGLLFAIGVTIVAFGRIDRRAGSLLVPYLLWVVFATYLNAAIVIG